MKEHSLQSHHLCELQIVERQVGIQAKKVPLYFLLIIKFFPRYLSWPV